MGDQNLVGQVKPHLSRDKIFRVSLQLADKEGIRGLSMRKIAHALGVKAMSLYNHVSNKEEIIDNIVDLVFAEIELPDPTLAWQEAMRRRAVSAHQVLLRHPWATLEMMSRMNLGEACFRYIDRTLQCLCEAGFSYALADYAWNAMDSHIYGFTLQQLNFPVDEAEYTETAEIGLPLIPVEQYPYMHAMTQALIAGEHDGIQNFEFGLNLILTGLEQLLIEQKSQQVGEN